MNEAGMHNKPTMQNTLDSARNFFSGLCMKTSTLG
jgi:hypothetical protein